jgi:hypothetical protein
MEARFNSSGNTRKHSYDEFSSIENQNIVRNDYSQVYSRSNFAITYQYDYLTRKRVDNFYSSLSGQYYFEKTDVPNEITKQFDPNFNWNFSGFRRYYLKEDKFFLEAGTSFGLYGSSSKITTANVNSSHIRNNSVSALINLGTGYGRIENANDLWQAYYILNKLKGQQSFARELNESDIFDFATFASKLKNKRFFDFRLQKMAELKALDSLLHKQGLIEETDIAYFNVLNDYWSFTYFHDRESGRFLKFWLSPEYSRHYTKSLTTEAQIVTKTKLVSNLSFVCKKQLNLFWERHLNILLSNENTIETTGQTNDNYPSNLFESNVEFGYGLFPNERTSISGSMGYQGYQRINQTTGDTYTKYWSNRIYLAINGNYYISPQLQINGNISFNYTDKIYNSINTTTVSYNLGLRYAIF